MIDIQSKNQMVLVFGKLFDKMNSAEQQKSIIIRIRMRRGIAGRFIVGRCAPPTRGRRVRSRISVFAKKNRKSRKRHWMELHLLARV